MDDRDHIIRLEPAGNGEEATGPAAARSDLFLNRPDSAGHPRRIDYILVYERREHDEEEEDDDDRKEEKEKEKRRKLFQRKLRDAGLVLEEEGEVTAKSSLVAVKVHGPWNLLTTYAELMRMKMPLKAEHQSGMDTLDWQCPSSFSCPSVNNPFALSEDYYRPEEDDSYTAPFRRDKMSLFQVDDRDTFFSPAERSRIVFEVMMRTRWSDSEADGVGIRRLVNSGVYAAAYPLHEGPYSLPEDRDTAEPDNDRQLLYYLWARPSQWYKYQPLDLVRKYFGEKVGIYFTWLGLYTTMLIPVSILGFIIFIAGVINMASYEPSKDICDPRRAGNYTMCPLCDRVCTYYKLSQSCFYSRWSAAVDNNGTIFFAIVMALWGTIFLELWKRRQAEIAFDWDVDDFEEHEAVRPEFECACRHMRLSPITGREEPYIPNHLHIYRYAASFMTVAVMICLVLAFVLGIVIYRVSMVPVFYALGSDLKSYAKLLTTATAATLNLVAILILSRVYNSLAIVLTNWEQPRTETMYNDSLTIKMYCFQFVNFYSSLFYIAFFKGRFVGRPGKYNYAFGYRPEECDPAGCLMELCVQMIIINVGKQIFNNFLEVGLPMIQNCFRRWQRRRDGGEKASEAEEMLVPQWEADWSLTSVTNLSMHDEYLEMVIQFGFVTLFVSAMPLAPLFAFLNNILEIRIDAFKMVTQWRRPFPARAQDIGVWYGILHTVAVISVITNAFIIGYTSDAIPRLVYKHYYNAPSGTLEGFVDFSLSTFDTRDFQNRSIPEEIPAAFGPTVDFCRYRGFRYPPSSPKRYDYSVVFWHVFTARFVFILVFEHFVFFLTSLVAWLVPDMPEKLRVQQKKERYLAQEAMFQEDEKALHRELRRSDQSDDEELANEQETSAL